ncbi:AarF/ABC1/UbiB kinase family protein [Desulfosporosinus sp. HMP52]|uniref:ABC1 kinase family protein n=1 Tax=Desulfosporosinus sp. HMP52 TaxID=1487923 RepID=UPI00068FC7D1|nr:AarF/ABC1/UbiB kinase family protein [Desulfosporosinus sp. HMP52]
MFGIPERHIARYYEILSVLLKHGLGYLFIPGNLNKIEHNDLALLGVHLRGALGELGATFIKVGQMASTRSDLLPLPIIKELEKLQDRVNPLPISIVRRVVEESLKVNLESVFKHFNPIPVASASIAQVHEAVLHNGEKVAVKVQRPFLHERVKTDLEIFQVLAERIELNTKWGKGYPVRLIVEEFSDTIIKELDFVHEGKNAEKIFKHSKKNSNIVVPKIYWELTNSMVLTMQYIPGIPLHQISCSEKHSKNVCKIANHLSKAFLQQILREGCFHADPHPGNILILPDGKISLIDFGIIGNLSIPMKAQLSSLASGIIRGDDAVLLKTLYEMGITSFVDRDSFQADIHNLRHKYLSQKQKKFTIGESIQDFFAIISKHEIHIPPEFVLVGKTFLTLEGTLRDLCPSLSLVEQAKPFSRRFIWRSLCVSKLWKIILRR